MAFKLKAIAAVEGRSKQAAARQFKRRKVCKRVVFDSQYQLLADVGSCRRGGR